MSWSFREQGGRDELTPKITELCDRIAAGYAGQEEEKDVLAIKDRALAALAEIRDEQLAPNVTCPAGLVVQVAGWGSHSRGYMSAHIEVSLVARPSP